MSKVNERFNGPAVSISFDDNRLLDLEMLVPCGFIVKVFKGTLSRRSEVNRGRKDAEIVV